MNVDARKRAEDAVLQLRDEHGVRQTNIAARIVVADSTICRILKDPSWPVSDTIASKLEREVAIEEKKRENQLAIEEKRRVNALRNLALFNISQLKKTIETCNRAGVAVDTTTLSRLEEVFSSLLIAACLNDSEVVDPLPDGIDAAAANITLNGEAPTKFFLVAVRQPSAAATDTVHSIRQLIAHEVEHIVEWLRAEPYTEAPSHRAESAY
jgi:hypothetical protein